MHDRPSNTYVGPRTPVDGVGHLPGWPTPTTMLRRVHLSPRTLYRYVLSMAVVKNIISQLLRGHHHNLKRLHPESASRSPPQLQKGHENGSKLQQVAHFPLSLIPVTNLLMVSWAPASVLLGTASGCLTRLGTLSRRKKGFPLTPLQRLRGFLGQLMMSWRSTWVSIHLMIWSVKHAHSGFMMRWRSSHSN